MRFNSRISLIFAALAVAAPAQPRDIGSRKQLLIDRAFIEHDSGIELRTHAPLKGGIVVRGDNTWENGLITDAITVIDDGSEYRMWYTACPAAGPELAPFKLCYAESDDGVHWRKPPLGLYAWQGSRANNIIMDSSIENGSGIFLDPKAPPAQRYKLLARLASKKVLGVGSDPQIANAPNGAGLYVYTSPDGLHWTLQPTRVFPFSPDTDNMALYDERTDEYLAYVRVWNPLRRVGVVAMKNILEPWPYAKVPPRLWPGRPHENPAPSREIEEAFGPAPGDPENVDFYTSAVVKYPWADDAYFMFPSSYRHFPEPPASKFHNDGLLDIGIAVSRDGRKFHRISHVPYVELGLPGSPDSGSMYMGVGMIRRENDILQYYGGYDFTHGGYIGLPEIRNRGGIQLLRQRLDGMVSADAGEKGGEFETPLLHFTGATLQLNLDASAAGEVRVEVRGEDGQPISGYAFSDSDVVGGNDTARTVSWRRGQSDLSALAGRPIRLAFRMRDTELYAFQFVP